MSDRVPLRNLSVPKDDLAEALEQLDDTTNESATHGSVTIFGDGLDDSGVYVVDHTAGYVTDRVVDVDTLRDEVGVDSNDIVDELDDDYTGADVYPSDHDLARWTAEGDVVFVRKGKDFAHKNFMSSLDDDERIKLLGTGVVEDRFVVHARDVRE